MTTITSPTSSEGDHRASRSDREEGELSPSDDQCQPACTVSIAAATVVTPVEVVSVGLNEKSSRGNQEGKTLSSKRSLDEQPLPSMRPEIQKKIEKKEVLSKSTTPGCGPPKADKNLVISFVDDSSSESDMEGQRQAPRPKSHAASLLRAGKPLTAPLLNLTGPRQIGRNPKPQSGPKNLPFPRAFCGTPYSRVSRPIRMDQRSQARNSNTFKRNPGERSSDQIVDLSNSKLQDLRQQIALCESKLKYHHKAVRLGNSGLDQGIDAAERIGAVSAEISQFKSKEPERKRLKVDGSFSSRPALDGRQPLTSRKSLLEKGNLLAGNKVDLGQPQVTASRKESTIDSNGSPNCNQSGNAICLAGPCIISHANAPQENTNSSTSNKNTQSEDWNCPNVKQIQQNVASDRVTRDKNHSEELLTDRLHENSNGDQQACFSNSTLWNCLDNINAAGCDGGNLQALIGLEESLDKELEDAQERRHKFEIEERNTFKAFRKAQRSLMEANARCAELYRKRELLSAHLRSCIMDNPGLLWSSMRREDGGARCDTFNNITTNVDLPKFHGTQPNHGDSVRRGYDQNISFASCGLDSSPYFLPGQNLGFEPSSEPDASISEGLHSNQRRAIDIRKSSSTDPNVSLDEDEETFAPEHDLMQHNFEDQRKDRNCEGTCKSLGNESKKNVSVDILKDSLRLEATLRSELFARLRGRTTSKYGNSCNNTESLINRSADTDGTTEKTQISDGSQFDCRGSKRLESNVSEVLVNIRERGHAAKSSSEFCFGTDSETNGYYPGGNFSDIHVSSVLSSYSLRSTFVHMKIMTPRITSLESESGFENESHSPHNDGRQWDAFIAASACLTEVGSYSCALELDPFWPLCMYELRGKCNNDECPWQHFKDFSYEDLHESDCSISSGTDCQPRSPWHHKRRNCAASFSQCSPTSTPPFLVSVDTMKVDSHAYVLARRHRQCWRRCFSISVASSSLLQKDFCEDARLLGGSESRIEVNTSWRTESSHFGSKNSITNQLKQSFDTTGQPLEMALRILNQEGNKVESIRKVLTLLSRGLESDPSSEALWLIYLLIYYSHTESVGKDDLFSYAVKNNKGSYALWLVYINSRKQLGDRLVAYDDALSEFCCLGSPSESNGRHASACILDIFLQMINCLCISGNVKKATERICGLLPGEAISDDSHLSLLSDILTNLTFSDKCVFWVCCVYLVIYRKLPDAVMQQLEFEKELHEIEWPLVDLIYDDKQRARKLLEKGVRSVELWTNIESLQNGNGLKSAHCFALCHVRCVVVLDGMSCCRELLEKYIQLFPSCLELRLIVARMEQNNSENLGFGGFEQILSSWPRGTAGVESIWNQYAEYSLQHRRYDFATDLMARWFNSYSRGNANLAGVDGDSFAPKLNLSKGTTRHRMDVVFSFLNLSLYHLLKNNYNEAREAIDRALDAGSSEGIVHCIREHAAFLLTRHEFEESKGDFTISQQLAMLNNYLDHASAFPVMEPLSRRFICNIEKQRLRELANNLLTPISYDFRVVNMILEVWYGPSLLPSKPNKQRDLVDFVEAILELVPSNFPLAFSVCKQLRRECSNANGGSLGIQFWAGSILVSSLSYAFPIPPEYVWVDAAGILSSIAGSEAMAERFYKKAFSVYPFSFKLWKFYYNLCKSKGDTSTVVEAAREKGIKID